MKARISLLQIFLTDLTPIIFRAGSAKDISKTAWMMPRMPPIIRADEADGMFLFSDSVFTILQLLGCDSNILVQSSDSDTNTG